MLIILPTFLCILSLTPCRILSLPYALKKTWVSPWDATFLSLLLWRRLVLPWERSVLGDGGGTSLSPHCYFHPCIKAQTCLYPLCLSCYQTCCLSFHLQSHITFSPSVGFWPPLPLLPPAVYTACQPLCWDLHTLIAYSYNFLSWTLPCSFYRCREVGHQGE